jgi:hypothetical protein
MPVATTPFPAAPECDGKQWTIVNEDELAELCALVLVGRARHVKAILTGVQRHPGSVGDALKEKLQAQLFPASEALTWHRDGLLFEIITWVIACQSAQPGDVVSDPHLKSTQQGIDTLQISFDEQARTITRAIIHEQKCTDHPRDQFRGEVLPAFKEWLEGKRDNQLLQNATAMLERFLLSDNETIAAYDRLLWQRPLAFQASLTVTPADYDQAKCVALFKDFKDLTPATQDRMGDTLPLAEIRPWFTGFAKTVWSKIEAMDV